MVSEIPVSIYWKYKGVSTVRFDPGEREEFLELLNYFNIRLGLSVTQKSFVQRAIQLYMYNLSKSTKERLKKELEMLHDPRCRSVKKYDTEPEVDRDKLPDIEGNK